MHKNLPTFFMLRAGETDTAIACGCRLINQVNAVFRFCPMHDRAPALLEALKETLVLAQAYLSAWGGGRADDKATVAKARAVIAAVEES